MPFDWTILHSQDPAMDLHLALLAEAADEALRSLRASDERAACQHKQPARRRAA
jgi:hypothetical protein